MLPATKAVPKELLPIGEMPALQLVIDEAVGAGVDHVVVVTSADKPAVENYFQRTSWVEESLDRQGRTRVADVLRRYGDSVRVSFVTQDRPRGLGHAIGCAAPVVGDQPFFVLLPDELMADSSLLVDLGRVLSATGRPAIALKRVPRHEVSRYGVIEPAGEEVLTGGVAAFPFRHVVEKPAVTDAPSDLIIIGRYALTPDVFARIDRLSPGSSGEIQLTDALVDHDGGTASYGVVSHIGRRDIGHPLGWFQAVVESGLRHPEFGDDFRRWLAELP
jgi:UTP--glucose-1-phosphate uridylyltransferase